MRAYPSAAPVATPSKRQDTQRTSGKRSSAATRCISDVPGLAKQTLMPPAIRARAADSAPFIADSGWVIRASAAVAVDANHSRRIGEKYFAGPSRKYAPLHHRTESPSGEVQ